MKDPNRDAIAEAYDDIMQQIAQMRDRHWREFKQLDDRRSELLSLLARREALKPPQSFLDDRRGPT